MAVFRQLLCQWLRTFFELTVLDGRGYLLIGLAALAWAVILRLIWRTRLLERFLQLDWEA